jgi:hypoxanthine phosphoribosyltransferase
MFPVIEATWVRGRAHGLDVYVASELIDEQVTKLAAALAAAFAGDETLLYCPVLNGGAFFYHDLARAFAGRSDAHLHEVAYVYASRYGAATRGREVVDVQWLGLEKRDVRDRTVVVVDDILEEGRTVEAVVAGLESRGVRDVITAFACRKVPVRTAFRADFVMFDIPADIWAVGYGMDLDNRFRGVRSILAAPRRKAATEF